MGNCSNYACGTCDQCIYNKAYAAERDRQEQARRAAIQEKAREDAQRRR